MKIFNFIPSDSSSKRKRIIKELGRDWYKFSRNRLSIVGLFLIILIVLLAVLAPIITPYPQHAGKFVNLKERFQPPSATHWFGTDSMGRDIFTRIVFGYRTSLLLGVVVLSVSVPIGVIIGLLGGFFKGTFLETICMRITDIFLAVPPLILALAVAAVLEPNLTNSMFAISLTWWPWYSRLVYGITRGVRNEFFVQSAEVIGAPRVHLIFKELLPQCISPIFTKVTLDMGFAILVGAALSFVGLGAQPPTPDLGTMVSEGSKYLPDQWWLSVFPALAIVLVVLAFNFVGDGLRDLFALEQV
ncbi:MAG: ABC transporter permease [Caldiserica bacterium]|jgi:peptide/nickel transport system permease protein|nr:ABC transporter permease [Caldisericota bacterium]MDH7562258.1 ABC transporter permease [Caldisericota bacterium]